MKSRLRISAGVLRGRPLEVPDSIRPTGGRVREALFSIWAARVEGARFLDLFAGSGAVGLEAWSRGAAAVTLVEARPEVLRSTRHNLRLAPSRAVVAVLAELPRQVDSVLGLESDGFDLIYADPPYRFTAWEELLTAVVSLAADDARLAIEHSTRVELPTTVEVWSRVRLKVYGESSLSFYEADAAASEPD